MSAWRLSLMSIPAAMLAFAVAAMSATPDVAPSIAAKPGEWRYLNSDPLSTRYAPLEQIGKGIAATLPELARRAATHYSSLTK